MIKPKSKKCRCCRIIFNPRNSLQIACGQECALKLAAGMRETRQRKALATEKKESRDKDKPYQLKQLEKACNAFVRERDKDLPCISCGSGDSRYALGGGIYKTVWQAGHYLAVGSHPELRFNPKNIHKQCIECNMHKAGNQIKFRQGLIARFSVDYVDYLEMKHPALHLTIDEIIELKKFYVSELKKLNL